MKAEVITPGTAFLSAARLLNDLRTPGLFKTYRLNYAAVWGMSL